MSDLCWRGGKQALLIDEGMQFYESDCKVYAGRGNGMLGLLSRVCTSVFYFASYQECESAEQGPLSHPARVLDTALLDCSRKTQT